jgi:hypothetical protein
MLKSIKLVMLLLKLHKASKPIYIPVGPSYQELDIANGEGSARIVNYTFKYGSRRFIIFNPYGNKPMIGLPLSAALELKDATTYDEVREIPGAFNVVNYINGPKWRE